MKMISLSEARANLIYYGRRCQDEPIIVTVDGIPSFQLDSLSEEDVLVDSLLEHDPKFRRMLKSRLRERSLSAKEALERM